MSSKAILLIEDSKLHQSFIQRALDDTRYDLTIVGTGIEGLSMLTKKRFDIVAVDVMLPDLNGLSVVRTMREMTQVSSIPVVMITSQSALDYENDISELNISAFIEKGSFRDDDFVNQLDRAVDATDNKRDIEVLLLEPGESLPEYVRRATSEPRFNYSQVLDRNTLEAFASSSLPDVILYEHRAESSESPNWVIPYYMDGTVKEIPWIVLFQNQIPKDFANLSENHLIMPLATPCSDIVLKKNIEFLAQIHQTNISSEEHSLELELACSELEKNRISLSQVRSELTHRKENFGDILLKISDEIRQPLTSILGYSEGPKRSSIPKELKNALDGITNNGRFLSQVADDILSIAAIEKNRFQINRQSFDLLAVLTDIREVAKLRARANNVSFAVRIENDIPAEVQSDSTLVKQILRGLIDNAVKFTKKGSIELKLFYDEKLNRLHLTVADTGPGIATEKLSSILSSSNAPFTSTTIAAGSGLGVSYVKFAAEQLGGELRVDSTPGKGSSFTVVIDPGECSETLSPELSYTILDLGIAERDQNPEDLTGKILISDARFETQKLFKFLLDRTKISYSFANDELETLNQALSDIPDLLIANVLQNENDGFGFIRTLRKRGFSNPILSIAPFHFDEQKIRCLDVGCDGALSTPFRVEEFFETIASLLNQTVSSAAKEVKRDLQQSSINSPSLPDLPLVPEILLPEDLEENSVVESLVIEFIDMLPQQLVRIDSALMSRDLKGVKDSAEELLNASQLYGYPSIADISSRLVESCNTPQPELWQHFASHLKSLAFAARQGRSKVLNSTSAASNSNKKDVSHSDSSLQKAIHSLFVDEPLAPVETVDSVKKPIEVDETGFFSSIPLTPSDVAASLITNLDENKTEPKAEQAGERTEANLQESNADLLDVNLATMLERIGDSLMSSNWQEATKAVEEFLSSPVIMSIDGATQTAVKLKVAIQTQNLEKAAYILDEMSSKLIPNDSQQGSTPTPKPLENLEVKAADTEINALLAELESQVGPIPEQIAEEPGDPEISDTSIFRLFDLDKPSAPESETDESNSPLEASQEQLSEPEHNLGPEDSIEEMSKTTANGIEGDGAIYSSLVKDEPSTAPLILDFLDELKQLVIELRTAFGEDNSEQMKIISDEVYGSAGICGYESCAQIAKALSNELDLGCEKDNVDPLLSELETVCSAMFKGRESLLQW